MKNNTKPGARILAAALALGLWGDVLLREIPWALNLSLWMAGLALAQILTSRWRRETLAASGGWWLFPLIVFSAALAWRDSPVLKMLNVLALLVALSLFMLLAQGGQIRLAGLMDYALGSLIAGLNAVFGAVRLLFNDVEWKEFLGGRETRISIAVGRGLLFAFPLLLIFGGLFVQADAVFKGIVENILHLDFHRLLTHFFVTAFCAWIVGGFLRGALAGNEWSTARAAAGRAQFFTLGIIEIGTVLALLDLLFGSFVVIQIRYFFGGAAWVQASAGLSYAEYARRGFFELVIVAALVLPLLLLAHWLLSKERPLDERVFRGLAGAQILLLYVIMASAVERLRLYQLRYGLTELRFYTLAFIGWLAVVFAWFAVTVLTGRRGRFAFGAMFAGFLLIGILHFLNPDAYIGRANVARAAAGETFDARYAGTLSADAVPALLAAFPSLSPEDRCRLAARILKRWSAATSPDWRVWNWAQSRARRVVEKNGATLRAMACSERAE